MAYPEQSVSHCLDAKDFNDFNNVVRYRPCVVHVRVRHHSKQVCALSIQNPFSGLGVFALCIKGDLVSVLSHKHLLDALNTLIYKVVIK